MADPVPAPTRRVDPASATLVALLLGAGLLLLFAGRHLTFFFDEWSFILSRRGGSVSAYLDPHNGHLSLVPVAVYKLLFAIVGLRHYTPYRAVGIAVHLLAATILYLIIRQRLGPWLALVPTSLLLLMGTAFQDLLWPFQIGFLASVAAGLGALLLIERHTPRSDLGASLLLALALAASGVGVPFLLASATLLLASGSPWRRLWVIAVPAALFVLWYVGWGTSEHVTTDSILAAPQYIADAAAGAAAGTFGLSRPWGPPLALAALATIVLTLRRTAPHGPSPMLLAAAVGALAFWGLSAIARADAAEPAASRYLYIGAVFIMLLAAEARVGAQLRAGALVLCGLVVLGALIANLSALRAGERGLRAADASVSASLAVVELAAPVIAPGFRPEPGNAPAITAGGYLAAVRDLGSPALTLAELEHAPESTRLRSDGVLERAEQLRADRGTTPVACRRLQPTAPLSVLGLDLPPGGGLLVRASRGDSAAVYIRRLASGFESPPFATVPGGASTVIRFPNDRAPRLAWQVRVIAPRPVSACIL